MPNNMPSLTIYDIKYNVSDGMPKYVALIFQLAGIHRRILVVVHLRSCASGPLAHLWKWTVSLAVCHRVSRFVDS